MNLDLIPNGAIRRVHVSQNDIGRTLTFELFNNSTSYTVPSGAVVKIQGTKPSGLGFSETCTVSGNTVTVDTTETMTDESGNIQTELSISYDDVVIGTSNFVLAVEKNPHPDTTTDGSMETIIPELTLLVNEVKGYAEEIEGTYHVYGSPWVASTVAQMTDTDKIYVYVGSESGYTNGNWYYYNGTAWVSGGVYNSVAVQTDTTLSVSGMPADAKVVGDDINTVNIGYVPLKWTDNTIILRDSGVAQAWNNYSATGYIAVPPYAYLLSYTHGGHYVWSARYDANKDYVEARVWDVLNQDFYNDSADFVYFRLSGETATVKNVEFMLIKSIDKTLTKSGYPADAKAVGDAIADIESGGSGLTDGAKQALLNCFAHVAWIDEHGQDYYDALEDALYPPATLTSISAVYTQSGTVYDTDSLDSLKSDLVVTAHYDNGTTQTVTTYTLSGTLAEGTSTITVSYGGKTTTFNVTVTEAPTDTTPQVDSDHADKGQSSTFGSYTSKTNFYPTIKYELGTLTGSPYDYICGIIPVDATGSNTCRAWFWKQDDTGVTGSAYGTGKPMNVYAETMTEGSVGVKANDGYLYITIPVHIDYLDDSYLYVQSSGKVLFAGQNTPYYGMINVSEAS